MFELGKIVATPDALAALQGLEVTVDTLLDRHRSGDWGVLGVDDWYANDDAVRSGERILSAYRFGEVRIWVITESDRSVTTLLLPSEY